ncbi:type VII secretion-associated protein [Rhodococcus sp. IEGM 1330]|uniref:type VII secretion-associated protein n=1 Tax=Rhodococcus sp. IEGM 1330 TaxID=3082225 RepID=UPI002955D1A4|nr:type VII secretion-associated protein [Rhodococcus sp. IEGM 1330]MDV8020366.1 type VII secretion-associated protein [Rhodococcus sp. IEGM 1330]
MTSPSWRYAAVHLGYTEISVVATGGAFEGPRESVGSAFAAAEGGRLVFGRGAPGDEIPPLLCIDDASIPVGTTVWDREAVLHGIVWSALQGAGVHDRLDVLEIAYPSTWGEQRSGILRAMFATSANEVVLVETAEAALSWSGERAPSAAVVVEVGALDTSVVVLDESGAHGGDTGAILPFGAGDDDGWRRAVGEYVRSSVVRCPDEVYVVAPCAGADPVVDHPTQWLTGLDIARSLYRRAGADLVPAPSVRAATTRSAAWLDDVTAPPRSREKRRPLLLAAVSAAAAVIAFVCAALYFAGQSQDGSDIAAAQPFSPVAAPSATASSVVEPLPTTTADAPTPVETVTFVSGRVSMRLPGTWTAVDDPDRMVLIPPTPPERRIVVTVADLLPGSTQEQVADELRSAIDARGPDTTIGSLEPTRDFGGRVGIAYTERPIDDSTVLWRVFVESDLQVSIGCQFEGDDATVIDAECGQATQTLDIVPAS